MLSSLPSLNQRDCLHLDPLQAAMFRLASIPNLLLTKEIADNTTVDESERIGTCWMHYNTKIRGKRKRKEKHT